MKPCKTFIQNPTVSTPICRNCGCQEWEHNVAGKGLLAYMKAQPQPLPLPKEELEKRLKELITSKTMKELTLPPMGEELYKLFNEALKEEMKKEMENSIFYSSRKYFIDEN